MSCGSISGGHKVPTKLLGGWCWIWRTWGFLFEDKTPSFLEDILVCIYIYYTIAILQKSGQLNFGGKVDVHVVERRAVFQAMLFHVAVGIGILDE